MPRRARGTPPSPKSILVGQDEAIFRALPQRVLDNLRRPASENALVWNLLYPLAQPSVPLSRLLGLRPLWGTQTTCHDHEPLTPYFWGFSIEGERLPRLDEALDAVDGPGPRTEVDVFFLGRTHLILLEAKHLSRLGRCSRYQQRRCPEIHGEDPAPGVPCRYWEPGEACFSDLLDIGPRPDSRDEPPPCSTHYQLARTLLLGRGLGARLDRQANLWMMVPQARWPSIEPDWGDFAERVRDDDSWRSLRVIAWEAVRSLA